MKRRLYLPIRFKFMLTFLVVVTAVVAMITFSTANLFQEDKKAYVNGLTSMVSLATAEEARSLLTGHRERLMGYARLLLDEELSAETRTRLSKTFFEDFPELISVTLRRSGEEPFSVYNLAALEPTGVDRQALDTFRKEHPLALDRLLDGETIVENSSVSERLPSYTISFAVPDEAEPTTVSVVLRAERLIRLVSRFSAYDVCLVDAGGAIIAHREPKQVTGRALMQLAPEVEGLNTQHSAGVTLEYEQDGTETIGGFASVDFAGLVAVAQIPRSAAHLASQKLMRRLLVAASILLALAIGIGFAWALRITRPVETLSRATRQIAKGEFEVSVAQESGDEIGRLASSFNQMAHELKTRDEKLHEAHAQLVQSEKLAAFGQLGAGIAHEVKNPLAGILGCAQVAKDEVVADSQVHKDLLLIEKETRRCKAIIDNLLRFARQERAVMDATAIDRVVADAIAIVHHQLELNQVKLEQHLAPDLPPVRGNANQLQQVFMNLMINAQQAMDGTPGSIRITACPAEDGFVELRFADTGPGMSQEVQRKLFEPFFTTKPTGKGTGLGLSVSFGIIEDHEGSIAVESEVGQGATFVIRLPVAVVPEAQPRDGTSVKAAGSV